MSGNGNLTELGQDIIAGDSSSLTYNYLTLSAAVLMLYDFFLTLPLEMSQIWTGRINVMKALFVLNKYFGLIFVYSSIFLYFFKPATSIDCSEFDSELSKLPYRNRCSVFNYMQEGSSVIVTIAINSVFTLRTYAIYERSSIVLVLLLVPGLVSAGANIWATVATTAFALPLPLQIGPNTCGFTEISSEFAGYLNVKAALSNSALASLVGFVSGAVFDALVVVLTVCRTARLYLKMKRVNIKKGLIFILFRDGIFYYSIIFLPTFVIIALSAVDLKTTNSNIISVSQSLTTMFNALEIIIVSRLVLNLSHTVNTREVSEFRNQTGLEPPIFATDSPIGNIGGSFRTIPDDVCEEPEEGLKEEECSPRVVDNVSTDGDLEMQRRRTIVEHIAESHAETEMGQVFGRDSTALSGL